MTDSVFKLALRLLKNGIRFRWQHIWGKPGTPQALSLEITHDCVARCVMCNIWKIPREVPNLAISQCRTCTEPGLERYSLPYEGLHYLRLLLKMRREDFFRLHEHMGLDKYLAQRPFLIDEL